MKLTDYRQAKSLDQLRSLKRKKLVERHKGDYIATSYPENHLLPFERRLRSLDKTSVEFTECPIFDFLHQEQSKKLTPKELRGACESIYGSSDKGEDCFVNTKKTITKHIKSITGRSLDEWFKDTEFDQDALRTAYLLYDLHLATPSGLAMLTKKADPRFAEVELFTSHHHPKNTNTQPEDDQVILLSAWLKEFFSKALFHRSEIERGMAKNLDLILVGYLHVHSCIEDCTDEQLRTKLHSEVFDDQIATRTSQPKEPLSTKLMRAWQNNVKSHNQSHCDHSELTRCFLDADKPKDNPRPITNEVNRVLVLGARLFSWVVLQAEIRAAYHQLNSLELQQLRDIAKDIEDLIHVKFTNDYKNGTKLRVKGIGEDSKKTSLFNSLKALVENNQRILETNQNPFSKQINHDDNCETHYKYFVWRAYFACQMDCMSAQEFLSKIQRSQTQNESVIAKVTSRINSMTLNELNSDINRINRIMSNYTKGEYRLLPLASEIAFGNDSVL